MTALDALKAHLNILDTADDELLTDKLDAAVTFTSHHIGAELPLEWDTASADVRQAVLMLAGHWFENREATLVGITASETPIGYFDLLLVHRRWVF